MKPTGKPFSFQRFARDVKPFISASYSADVARRVKPFITATDSDEMRTLKLRCIAAMRHAARAGRRVDDQCAAIAGWIASLSGMREHRPEPGARMMRKILIEHVTGWLGPALLEAAEQGRLSDIARILDRRRLDPIANRGHYRVIVAYMNILNREKRPPVIGELLRQLSINKPRRTKDNTQEWLRVNSRERVIREILRQFDLPLSSGKRGRPR